MRKEGSNILLFTISAVLVITAIIAFPYSLIRYSEVTKADGTILTQEFVESYVGRVKYNQLFISSFAALLFGGFGVLLSLAPKSAPTKLKGWAAALIWVIISLTVTGIPAYRSAAVFLYEPHVDTVQVIDRSMVFGRHKTIYKFTFSNYSTHAVSQEEYETVPDGSTYYVIMNGGSCTGVFDSSEYSLPEAD